MFTLATEDRLAHLMVRAAGRFVGLRETKSNSEWDNPLTRASEKALSDELLGLMRPTPWEPGWAYCIAFCEAVVRLALSDLGASADQIRAVTRPITAGVMVTRDNLETLGHLSKTPVMGSIWLARHGKSRLGHAGIVTAVHTNKTATLATVEANTNLDASNPAKDREGDWITTRIFPARGRGDLATEGFLTPRSILSLAGI